MAVDNGYLSLEEAKAYLQISDLEDNVELEVAIESASRLIDNYCNRRFYGDDTATAKTFRPDGPWRLWTPDFHTTDGLVVKVDSTADGTFDTTWADDDFQVEPLNPENGFPYTSIVAVDDEVFPNARRRPNVEVTAKWGWASVPKQVKHACAIQTGTLFKRATEGAAPIVTVDGTTLHSSQFLDHQAKLLLDPLRRLVVA